MNLIEEYPVNTWVTHVIDRGHRDNYTGKEYHKETFHEAMVIGHTKKMIEVSFLNGAKKMVYPYQVRKRENAI